MDYLRDPAAIYEKSFAIVRAEADLARFAPDEAEIVVRLIHACGMPEIVDNLVFSEGSVAAGRDALASGAAVLCDTEMVRHGIIRSRLPADNPLLCEIRNPKARALAEALETTLSAGAIEALKDRAGGAIVVIGNAPTALFHLLERLDSGWKKPALILGFPVGFVGAAESKAELAANSRGVPFVTLQGRRGGSAIASAAVNALSGAL